MLKVLVIFVFYIHLNYGAPEIYTFNFTDMPSSIHLNFNVKPGKTVGPEGTIKPVITVEPEPVITAEPEPVITVEPKPVITEEPEPVTTVEPESVITVKPEPVITVEPEPESSVKPEPGIDGCKHRLRTHDG